MDVPDDLERAWEEMRGAAGPLEGVVAARRLAAWLAAWEADLIAEASSGGVTWETIGRTLGMSRQAAWERYRRDVPPVVQDLGPARERQRRELDEARRLRRQARSVSGAQRAALLAEAEERRAAALRLLDETRGTRGELDRDHRADEGDARRAP